MVDLSCPISISIPIAHGATPNAFHLPYPEFAPFRAGDFVGSVEEGGPVRCDVVTFAPHGNGTHTECVGHIAGQAYVLTDCLRSPISMARLVTVSLEQSDRGLVVSRNAIEDALKGVQTPSLVVRTLPNHASKRSQVWSGANPPFVHADAMKLIVDAGIQNLIIDLPSVDPEEDGGALEAHHIFWQWPHAPRVHCTISELVFIPDTVPDGLYGICIGAAPFVADAAPSWIALFPTKKQE